MEKITPFLWFNEEAEEAAEFYVSLFPDSKIETVTRYGDDVPGPQGKVMTVVFRLAGQRFMALNGGPQFPFTEAISLAVDCASQDEVDELWEKLSAGGEEGRCGWLKDRWGLSWQIVPSALAEMMERGDDARRAAVMQALLKMDKLEIAGLQAAFDSV